MESGLLLRDYLWISQVVVVVVATLLLDFLLRWLMRRLERRLLATPTPWDETAIRAVRPPLLALVWILGLAQAVAIARRETDLALLEALPPLRALAVIAIFSWFLLRLVKIGEEVYMARATKKSRKVDRMTVDTIGKLLTIGVFITAVLVSLQTLGFSISGLLAFGGMGGVVVGFAARDLLANFFGGLMLFLDRPFAIGDWIRSPDKDIEGVVEHISWRLTHIRTFDKCLLYVPNSTFSNISVENPSRMSNRRIYETIGIRYDDAPKMADIVNEVREMLRGHPEIDTSQTLIVNFNGFAPSSLDFFIYTFTRTTEWVRFHEVKEDVLLKVIEIIDSHGAEIAFPTSTLHLAGGGAAGFQGRERAIEERGGGGDSGEKPEPGPEPGEGASPEK